MTWQVSHLWLCLCLFCADPVCGRPVLRHRPGANVQILLPETQSESHQLLPGRSVGGSDRLADHWSRSGDLRFLPLIQVSSNRKKENGSLYQHYPELMWLFLGLTSFSLSLFHRGFFPVAVGFIRRIPVLGSLLSLPGISTVSIMMINQSQIKCTLKLTLFSVSIMLFYVLIRLKSCNNILYLTVRSWKTLHVQAVD